jgi:hypothetical protein
VVEIFSWNVNYHFYQKRPRERGRFLSVRDSHQPMKLGICWLIGISTTTWNIRVWVVVSIRNFLIKALLNTGTISMTGSKGPITWSIFNPGVELSPVYRVEISALSVIQNSIKIKRAITWQNFQPRAEFNPGVEISTLLAEAGVELSPGLKILWCNRFNPGLKLSWVYIRAYVVMTITRKQNKGFFTSGNRCRECIV